MNVQAINTDRAPKPKGAYNQAIACGNLIFLSGQTPRDLKGQALSDLPFGMQARRALDNLEAVAKSGNLSLGNAVKVTVYLRNLSNAAAFDEIYRSYISEPWPARTLVQSSFIDFELEIDAILFGSSSTEK
jgi:2-iminobutanoate/2-iminopropanoate deaminase